MTWFTKAMGGLRSVVMFIGLALFGTIFIIAPQLAANLGIFYLGLVDE